MKPEEVWEALLETRKALVQEQAARTRVEGEVADLRLWVKGLVERIILLENRALRAATREGGEGDGT